MLTCLRERDSKQNDISRIQELELRVLNLEAVVKDLKVELNTLKQSVNEEDIEKIQKYQSYQRTFDLCVMNKKAG